MDGIRMTTRGYTARAYTRAANGGRFRGYVILSRSDGDTLDNTEYETEYVRADEHEALDDAEALVRRIVGELSH
ncbi:hypothetical protein [Burkholderia plantarii]|uniref:hypothetical protein n=1 Tax=Burkholderia plantarii TaxID=41899 RepID=UPI0008706656|nr:hypothetical protein [Burkholderia plantarii]